MIDFQEEIDREVETCLKAFYARERVKDRKTRLAFFWSTVAGSLLFAGLGVGLFEAHEHAMWFYVTAQRLVAFFQGGL